MAGSVHKIAIADIHFTKSTFDKNCSYCVSYLISEINKGNTIKTNCTKATCKQF